MTKICRDCGEDKTLKEFYKSKNGVHGVGSFCKVCYKRRYYDKKKATEAAYRYRERNRERWLSLHRIMQYNRKNIIKITKDGTVTDEFLGNLYATEICYYCKSPTPMDSRTADHKIPLSRKGLHTADNLVMACLSCNSSKGAKTEEEYKCQ